ncbi:PTS sugar transporter subunit IIA [Homoserinibacter sp. YIM 151385]|uniref:PTS sugar transporter subunit IIA n=1 Tax=Homoserinibacter sp. YIM 151385 TaxID=2985506 RepID=UPI0022F11570|nr:PTS sugar transporter subunit IIA [Homoserinibacter sp. YIM 151385]WBU38622.1 PTS sugar transporter subunit IIA [Homoserinibacter sp. YIM 151385]
MSDEAATPLTELLSESSIRLDATASSRDEAIRQAGQALLEAGAIDDSYIDAMLERENTVSTYVGEGVAIPHGTLAGKDSVKQDALSVLRFPEGVDWDGNDVRVAVGIAAKGNGHIALLSQLATVLLDPDKAEALRNATTSDEVYELLAAEDDEDE